MKKVQERVAILYTDGVIARVIRIPPGYVPGSVGERQVLEGIVAVHQESLRAAYKLLHPGQGLPSRERETCATGLLFNLDSEYALVQAQAALTLSSPNVRKETSD